ncbi:hypothetical protein J5X98_19475 [Leptothermofonsia sichuanensis E412]|uniref:hypothetical protein n=1 Tax=Leptothermofonsia sichuanensis TaxID=2917832 RepID=UPI001CA65EAA|nr:hypothetical protein [Leptothermofonsia sichuanensis]QZZ19513.1 hypothetical protein J5X98_19475 [Leptothermofonsia sichuanensis E412]
MNASVPSSPITAVIARQMAIAPPLLPSGVPATGSDPGIDPGIEALFSLPLVTETTEVNAPSAGVIQRFRESSQEEVSVMTADLSDMQPGISFLGLPPVPPLPDPTPAKLTRGAASPAPPLPVQPERPPVPTRQFPPVPDPVLVMTPPRPALSLNDYLNRRKRGNG